MAKVVQPMFIIPKKRNNKKPGNNKSNHIDHIITIQGVEDNLPKKHLNLSPVSEQIGNGIIHSTMDGFKSSMKINLPIINDHEEYVNDFNMDDPMNLDSMKNCFQSTNLNTDLSPIYENSSEACSIHDDLKESAEMELYCKSAKLMNADVNDSSSATPNSLSLTHSDNSIELGNLTDSLKNSSKKKIRVNIVPEIIENDTDNEITALKVESEDSISHDYSSDSKDGYLTMSGTIKRGKKKGHNVDVKLNISREELEMIEASIVHDEFNKMKVSKCSLYNGPHIFLFSFFCLPFVALISALYSFYIGTLTWYSIFTHTSEEFNCFKKVLLIPFIIMLYPFLITFFTIGLGLYAGIVQLTFSGSNWWKDVSDFEKGFYGWFCNFIGLSECSPYEVIILIDVKST